MESTKGFIIETANRLFLEKGYSNVTVIDICNECNITKTTFYYHLSSKEDIILDFYDDVTHNISQQLVSILSAPNHWEQLVMCFEYLADETIKYGFDFISQLFITNLKVDYKSFDLRDELTDVAEAIIINAQNSGEIRNKSKALELYIASAYAFTGTELMWCLKDGKFEWKKELRQILENIYDVDTSLRL